MLNARWLLWLVLAGACSSVTSASPDLASAPDLAMAVDLQAVPSGPVLSLEHPSHGIFQLSWTLPASGCDAIDVERRINGGAFATVTTLGAGETTYTDVDHADEGTFCYRVQCTAVGKAPGTSNLACAAQ